MGTQEINQFDLIVVGAGASGMMAAGVAAYQGKKVLLLEKNDRMGEKLRITGGGRCNILNAEEDVRTLLKNYGDAEQFLYSPFAQFGMPETIKFFENIGVPIVVQARKRAFPATEKANDVYKALERYIKKGGVTIKTGTKVSRILTEGKKVIGIKAGTITYTATSYIIATGGLSHPETGSTGDGFNWLKALGHSIATPTPTIVPLAVREAWSKSLSGVSLSFMKITFYQDMVKKFSKTGKLLFTHFGLSGPLILNSAGAVQELLDHGKVTATIDAYPDTDIGALEEKILAVFDANKNKILKNVFDDIAPLGTGGAIMSLIKSVTADTKVHSITKEQRRDIANTLKALPLTITELMGYDRAVVADGGVALTDVDMRTMRSKHFDNLFITGDLLHITRPSGGFSLQLCWTSGYIAAMNA